MTLLDVGSNNETTAEQLIKVISKCLVKAKKNKKEMYDMKLLGVGSNNETLANLSN